MIVMGNFLKMFVKATNQSQVKDKLAVQIATVSFS